MPATMPPINNTDWHNPTWTGNPPSGVDIMAWLRSILPDLPNDFGPYGQSPHAVDPALQQAGGGTLTDPSIGTFKNPPVGEMPGPVHPAVEPTRMVQHPQGIFAHPPLEGNPHPSMGPASAQSSYSNSGAQGAALSTQESGLANSGIVTFIKEHLPDRGGQSAAQYLFGAPTPLADWLREGLAKKAEMDKGAPTFGASQGHPDPLALAHLAAKSPEEFGKLMADQGKMPPGIALGSSDELGGALNGQKPGEEMIPMAPPIPSGGIDTAGGLGAVGAEAGASPEPGFAEKLSQALTGVKMPQAPEAQRISSPSAYNPSGTININGVDSILAAGLVKQQQPPYELPSTLQRAYMGR